MHQESTTKASRQTSPLSVWDRWIPLPPEKKTKQNSLDSQIEGLPVQSKPHTHRNTDTALGRIVYHCEGLSGIAVHSRSDRLLPCTSSHATPLRQLSRAENNSKAARQGVVKQAATESIWQQVPTYFYFSRQASISRSTRLATSTPLNTERMGWSIDICFVVAVHQDFQSASGWRCSLGNSVHIRDDGNNKSNTRSRRWATSNECNLSTATVAATRWNGTPGISAAVVKYKLTTAESELLDHQQ